MNDSYGRSPQFAFSNCKLSPLFLSNYSPRNDQKIYFADYIDTQFIQSGRMLNKIARIENCPIELNYPRLSDINTSQIKINNNSSYNDKNDFNKHEMVRDPQTYLSNFNTNFTKEDQNLTNPKIKAVHPVLDGHMPKNEETLKAYDKPSTVQENEKINFNNINPSRNYSEFNRPIINSSIMRRSQSAFTENSATPKMNVTIINNNSYTINNFPPQEQILSKKRTRNPIADYANTNTTNFKSHLNAKDKTNNILDIQPNNKSNTHESSVEEEESDDVSYEDNPIGVNKITKRMIEENIRNSPEVLPRIGKLKKSKKNKNIKLKLEENHHSNISIHYQCKLNLAN